MVGIQRLPALARGAQQLGETSRPSVAALMRSILLMGSVEGTRER